MALRPAILLLLMAVALVAEASNWDSTAIGLTSLSDGEGGLDASSRMCGDLVGECGGEESEMGMESEMSRRGLFGVPGRTRFISYGALARNRVPCNRRGQSYYNCVRRGRANPYRRGCSVITRCARFLH